jgi:hypothetical protein
MRALPGSFLLEVQFGGEFGNDEFGNDVPDLLLSLLKLDTPRSGVFQNSVKFLQSLSPFLPRDLRNARPCLCVTCDFIESTIPRAASTALLKSVPLVFSSLK